MSKTFGEVSPLIDSSENSLSYDYYATYELKKIKVKQEDLWALNFNISSLSAYIDGLKNLLSELRINLDKICIYKSRLSEKNL